jgi:lysozyme
MILRASPACLALIKRFESLALKPYLCPAGRWTVGYGHTSDVVVGLKITPEYAEQLLREDLEFAERAVTEHATVLLSQAQFDALCSFVFNVGVGNFAASTLLKKLNVGDYYGASQQFERWNHAGGRELAGLTKRRQAEAALFLS